jgi:hypothetical protein
MAACQVVIAVLPLGALVFLVLMSSGKNVVQVNLDPELLLKSATHITNSSSLDKY